VSNIIEQMIGAEAFAVLQREAGGTDYKVPGSLDSPRGQELTGWIGVDAARTLIGHAGGDALYVAGGRETTLRQRYTDIMRMHHEQGLHPAQIARQYRYVGGYSERQIWAVLAGDRRQAEAIIRQGDLFL
jgi:hypothetical protein